MLDITVGIIFLLVLVRVTAFLVASPIFSLRTIPGIAKIGLGVTLALVLTPQLLAQPFAPPGHFLQIMGLVVKETLVGLVAGLAASFVMAAIRVGGQYLDLQAGFAAAQIFDPGSGVQNTLIAQFLYMIGLVLFFSMDAHHYLIIALAKSFEIVKLGSFYVSGALFLNLLRVFLVMFTYAFRIAMPVILVLVIVDLSLGYVSRIVPQLNVFMAGFPLKIGLGILILTLLVPLISSVIGSLFQIMYQEVMLIFGGY